MSVDRQTDREIDTLIVILRNFASLPGHDFKSKKKSRPIIYRLITER